MQRHTRTRGIQTGLFILLGIFLFIGNVSAAEYADEFIMDGYTATRIGCGPSWAKVGRSSPGSSLFWDNPHGYNSQCTDSGVLLTFTDPIIQGNLYAYTGAKRNFRMIATFSDGTEQAVYAVDNGNKFLSLNCTFKAPPGETIISLCARGSLNDYSAVVNTRLVSSVPCDDTTDTDGDGLSNLTEYNIGSDYFHADTDEDGLSDYDEYIVYDSNPTLSDTDEDTITDYDEVFTTDTDPAQADTDHDGWRDAIDPDPTSRAWIDWGNSRWMNGNYLDYPYWPSWCTGAIVSGYGYVVDDGTLSSFNTDSDVETYGGSACIFVNPALISGRPLGLTAHVDTTRDGFFYLQLRNADNSIAINNFLGDQHNAYTSSVHTIDLASQNGLLKAAVPFYEDYASNGTQITLHRYTGDITHYDTVLFLDVNTDGIEDSQLDAVLANPYADYDEDGLCDSMEYLNGLDFTDADQNNNAIPDGMDDFDLDGSVNSNELMLGTDPLKTPAEETAEWQAHCILTGASDHSLAVKVNGTVWAWGRYTYGQLGDGRIGDADYVGGWPPTDQAFSEPNPTQVILPSAPYILEVSAEHCHSIALDDEGKVYAWGSNKYGDLGIGDYSGSGIAAVNLPLVMTNLPPMRQISAGYFHNVGLSKEGDVWVWGSGWQGQLGAGWTSGGRRPQPLPLQDVIKVDAGCRHSLALKSDGTVWAWGWNKYGQIGNNSTNDVNVPTQVAGLTNVIDIIAANFHSVALKSDGTVWTWGENSDGQLGTASTLSSLTPVQVSNLNSAVSIAAGYHTTFAHLSDGSLVVWGSGGNGQLGDNYWDDSLVPIPIAAIDNADLAPNANIIPAGGGWHNLFMAENGDVYTWGCNHYGQLGYLTPWNTHRQPVASIGLNLLTD